MKFKLSILLVLVLTIISLFYWVLIRPARIESMCFKKSIDDTISTSDIPFGTDVTALEHANYVDCEMSNGLNIK